MKPIMRMQASEIEPLNIAERNRIKTFKIRNGEWGVTIDGVEVGHKTDDNLDSEWYRTRKEALIAGEHVFRMQRTFLKDNRMDQ